MHLGTVMRICNSQRRIYALTNTEYPAPAELIFGRAITLERNLFVSPKEFASYGEAKLHIQKWSDNMLQTQGRLLEQAEEDLRVRDEKFKSLKPIGTPVRYHASQYVLLDYPEVESRTSHRGPDTKFSPFLKGPFKVILRHEDATYYDILDLVNDKIDTVHVSRLRPFITDRTGANDETMREIAMTDYIHDYIVDHVIEHKGDPAIRRQLFFLVRWKGYGQDRDTWMSYSSLRDNELLHKYLLSKDDPAFVSLIPERHHAQYNLSKAQTRAPRQRPIPIPTTTRQQRDSLVLSRVTHKRRVPAQTDNPVPLKKQRRKRKRTH